MRWLLRSWTRSTKADDETGQPPRDATAAVAARARRAVAASAAAATAGGRPGNPAGREKNPRRMESHAESHEGWLTCAALP